MKKSLIEQLETAARKWAKDEVAGDERFMEAVKFGAKWWQTNSRKSLDEYEADLIEAIKEKNPDGKVKLSEKLQARKTARLWLYCDRLADELDMEERFMRWGQGSMKQTTESVDPRLALLVKYEAALTSDLAAMGLTANKADGRSGRTENNDPMQDYFEKLKN